MSKIGFWQLYRQAMIGGKNGEWYMLCSQAARQGVTRNRNYILDKGRNQQLKWGVCLLGLLHSWQEFFLLELWQ